MGQLIFWALWAVAGLIWVCWGSNEQVDAKLDKLNAKPAPKVDAYEANRKAIERSRMISSQRTGGLL